MTNFTQEMQPKKSYNLLIHFVVWLFYISLPFFISPESGPLFKTDQLFLKIHLLGISLSLILFYSNFAWAMPYLLLQKRRLEYLLYLLGAIVFILLVSNYFVSKIALIHPNFRMNPHFFVGFYFRLFMVLFMSVAVQFYKHYKKIEFKHNQAELASLKAQINPHFLFNTLNGIYAQALTNSENTADSIQKLSSMMRYVITESNDTLVPLASEVAYLRNYIELQKLRLTGKTAVEFNLDGDMGNLKIAPLLLICFVENAFKYGVSTEVNTQIRIDLSVENNTLCFKVKNDKPVIQSATNKSDKIGLRNSKLRLDLIYKNKYTLDILDDEETYSITLNISLS